MTRFGLAVAALGACLLVRAAWGASGPNGFDVSEGRVPAEEIRAGGPPRDGIQSVDAPEFVPPAEATWVAADNPVLGVVGGDEAHVYPLHVIERHQVVNDTLEETAVVVTYDPLAGVPRAFRRQVDGRTLTFGVSGLIYNHNFLLFDRETESLWAQFTGEALTGKFAGKRLSPLRIRQETLGRWLDRHPRSKVLRPPSPTKLDYRYSPFERYLVEDRLLFPVKAQDREFHAKELVLGVSRGGESRAYLGSLVTAAGGRVEDEFQGRTIRLSYDTNEGLFSFEVPEDVEAVEAYWLAWKAFHPETAVWRPASTPSGAE